ncbi:MAG: hypothetical protein ABW215_17265 [Kibdelosporangium sp.]
MVIALAVAVMGGVAVYAAGNTTSTSAQGGPGGGGMGGPDGGTRANGGGMGGLMNAVHGEFTMSDGNGGYRSAVMQIGTVTEVSSRSLTAKSADGYTKVYPIDADTTFGSATASDIATGDTVTVVATLEGDQATADSVVERGQGGPQDMPPGQDQN